MWKFVRPKVILKEQGSILRIELKEQMQIKASKPLKQRIHIKPRRFLLYR
jgi:hypothetical protein